MSRKNESPKVGVATEFIQLYSKEKMNSKDITLYGCPFQESASSSTWRVRAALHYKQLEYNEVSSASVENYNKEINPMGMIPAIKLPKFGDRVFSESLPILELLEETYPSSPKLLPDCPVDRYRVRHICEIVNAGMQPHQSFGTLQKLNLIKEAEEEFVEKMMLRGINALEELIDENFCVGNSLTMADLYFVPQIRNIIERWQKIDISPYPKVNGLYKKLKNHDCFQLIK